MRRRENTFRIDYANVPVKPAYQEIHEFIAGVLNVRREDVVRVQCSKSLSCAFVKVVDLEIAQKVVEEHGAKHEVVSGDKSYPVRLSMEDGAVDVRVTDLSEDVSDASVSAFLREYGEVIAIREELWGEGYRFEGFPNGVRVVKMMVKQNIPSYVAIDGETTCVSYFGQRQTCRHCVEFVHNGVSCVQNKKLLIQKLALNPASYANVTKSSQALKPPLKRPAEKQQAPKKPTGTIPKTTNNERPKQQGKPKPPGFQGFQLRGKSTSTTSLPEVNLDGNLMPPPPTQTEKNDPGLSQAIGGAEADPKGEDGNTTDTSATSTDSRTMRKKQRVNYNIPPIL